MPAKSLRVLLFSGDYWPDSGGIAAHVHYLSRALAKVGADVTLVGGHRTTITRARRTLGRTPRLREITVHKVGPRGIRGVIFALRAAWILLRQVRGKWDVVHFHNFLPDGLIVGRANWPRARVRVYTNHSHLMLRVLDQGRSTALLKWLVSGVSGIIGPSPELRDKSRAIQKKGQVTAYIPNGVDVEHFRPGDPTSETHKLLGLRPSQRVILAVRRHYPKSGLNYLVNASDPVIRKHPDVIFCLVGGGQQTELLKRMVADMGLEDQFRFLGTVSHEALPSIFHAAYVSVLPSVYEAVSLSGLESMACGIPVIGTRIGGIPEFVHHGATGLLIEPKSSDAIAEALIRLLENPSERDKMGRKARSMVVEEYSWDTVAKRTLGFYESLIRQ